MTVGARVAECRICGKEFEFVYGRAPHRCPECRAKPTLICAGCGAKLRKPDPTGLCGFCIEERAA